MSKSLDGQVRSLIQSATLRANIVSVSREVLLELQEEHFMAEGQTLSEGTMELVGQEVDKETRLGTGTRDDEHVFRNLREKVLNVSRNIPAVRDKERFADAFVDRLRHHLTLKKI